MSQRYNPNATGLGARSFVEQYGGHAFEDGDVAELFHENTKLTRALSTRVGRSKAALDDHPVLRLFQSEVESDYGGRDLVELPTDVELSGSLADALHKRRSVRTYGTEGLSASALSTLLLYSCGVTAEHEVTDPAFSATQRFRAYPSPGALYPVEVYPIVVHATDLDPGVYYYSQPRHGLRPLSTDGTVDLEALLYDPVADETPSVLLVLTGAFWRAKIKYGPRGYRYVLQESGHLTQNLLLVASAANVAAVPLGSFRDDAVNDLLGVDGVDEAALYAVALGSPPDRS